MLTRSSKCFAGILTGVLATLVVAPAAFAGTDVQLVPHRFLAPPTTAQCETSLGVACYNAAQFEQAYGTNQLYPRGITGAGQTIVIVDSYGSPTIQADLTTYDQQNDLPNPPSFNIITPEGAPPAYDPNDATAGGWAIETTLDVEMAHTMAPGANILLVETPVAETTGITGFPQIEAAEEYVINHHLGNVITQSFGAAEQSFTNPGQIYSLRYAYEDAARNGVTVLASAGDQGPTSAEPDQTDYYPYNVVNWPASDPLVTAVGGTQLHLDANGNRTAPDNVWNDTALLGSPAAGGGGVSSVFSRPSYQNSVARVVQNARGVPDISASAAVNGGANIYISTVNTPEGITAPGWYVVGGTSEASPLTAGIVSLADQVAHHGLGQINNTLYQLGDGPNSGITDILAGNNGVTFTNSNGVTYTLPGYTAGPGYDLASGLGTPYAPRLVYQLAAGSQNQQGGGGWGNGGGGRQGEKR
jgi:subtilase family serine protease